MKLLKLLVVYLALIDFSEALSVQLIKETDLYVPDEDGDIIYRRRSVQYVAYEPVSRLVYAAGEDLLHVIKVKEDLTMEVLSTQQIEEPNFYFGNMAVCGRYLIIAAQNDNDDSDGRILIYTRQRNNLFRRENTILVGAFPGEFSVSRSCKRILVNVRGYFYSDPNPEGFLVKINFLTFDLSKFYRTTKIDFKSFDGRAAEFEQNGLLIADRTVPLRFDLEPKGMCVDGWGRLAYVTCQGSNAIAVINIIKEKVIDIIALGYQDHSAPGQGLDASDKDTGIYIQQWPVRGLYQPDEISCIRAGIDTFVITANEGETRANIGYGPVAGLTLDSGAFPNAHDLKTDAQIGRLLVTTAKGDIDDDGDFDELYSVGARGISLWNAKSWSRVADTGDGIEQAIANTADFLFNADNEGSDSIMDSFDLQSNFKGPDVGLLRSMSICGGRYEVVFVSPEKPGAVLVYTLDRRNLQSGFQDVVLDQIGSGDLHDSWGELFADEQIYLVDPNDLLIVKAWESPDGRPLLVVGAEDSGTVVIYAIDVNCD